MQESQLKNSVDTIPKTTDYSVGFVVIKSESRGFVCLFVLIRHQPMFSNIIHLRKKTPYLLWRMEIANFYIVEKTFCFGWCNSNLLKKTTSNHKSLNQIMKKNTALIKCIFSFYHLILFLGVIPICNMFMSLIKASVRLGRSNRPSIYLTALCNLPAG